MIQDYYRKKGNKMKRKQIFLKTIIVLISLALVYISFFGINKKDEEGNIKNLIPEYRLGMEFNNKRIIKAKISEEEITTIYDKEGNIVNEEDDVEYKEEEGYRKEISKVNNDEVRNIENYKKTKDIIEKKLQLNILNNLLKLLKQLKMEY